jgi:hypothetical protein
MEPRKVKPIRRSRPVPPEGFEVMLEVPVGFVEMTFGGDVTPMVAAMTIIANHHEESASKGVYRFPGPHGPVMVQVEVEG